MNFWKQSNENPETSGSCSMPLLSSAATIDGEHIIAAVWNRGIFKQTKDGEWLAMGEGLPDSIIVYRLQVVNNMLFAATDCGLYVWQGECWNATEIRVPCYQIEAGGGIFVACEQGFMFGSEGVWVQLGCHCQTVLSLLITPQFLYMGIMHGVAYYDVMMDEWNMIPTRAPVVSLAGLQGRLIGILAGGSLVIGDQCGDFQDMQFEGITCYRLIEVQGSVYVCANRGLFRAVMINKRLVLQSAGVSCPVTDVMMLNNRLLVATMQHGFISIPQ